MDDKDFIDRLFDFKKMYTAIKLKVNRKKNKSLSECARKAGNDLYAKKNHDDDIHKDVLLHYTKSIAFAPKDSEELALGLSNRSVLLLHVHRYKESLIDIDRALEITKSDELKIKLESRKEIAEKKMTNNATESKSPNIAKTSEKIPCAADCVSIDKNDTYKRQLTATRDIKTGEIVIIEKAYACCPNNQQIYLSCSHCLAFAWNGIPCDFCVYCVYCSETCKKEAWKEYHSIECSIIPFFHIDKIIDEPMMFDLPARVFIKAVKAEGFENIMHQTELIDNGILDLFSDGTFTTNKFGYLYSLRCQPRNEQLIYEDCIAAVTIMYVLMKHTNLIPVPGQREKFNSTDEQLLIRLRDILLKITSILNLNGYRYQWFKCSHKQLSACKNCHSARGVFIAPFSGIMNHSCVENLGRFSLPLPRIIVYAMKPIKKGEQLFISYGPAHTTSLAERKLFLEKMWYTCKCLACEDNQLFTDNNVFKNFQWKLNYDLANFEFKRKFGINPNTLYAKKDGEYTVLNEKSLKQACKLIELYYKHLKFNEACNLTGELTYYVRTIFDKLYGEKCALKC